MLHACYWYWHHNNHTSTFGNNISYVCDYVPAALRFFLLSLQNLSHAAWNHFGTIVSCQISSLHRCSKIVRSHFSESVSEFSCACFFCFFLPSACKWKTTTEAVVDGWMGLLISSSSLAAEKEGESVGSSLSVTLAGREGSRASMGAMMQWDSRHSGLTLKKNKKQQQTHYSMHFRSDYQFL